MPEKAPAKKAAARKPAKEKVDAEPAAAKAPRAKKAAAPAAERAPVRKTRVVFPKDVYEPRKDDIKAPFKAHELKWAYLGEGKGLYKKEGVNVFAQFLDDGVHYSLWGSDEATVKDILARWETLLGRSFVQQAQAAGEAAVAAERKEQESEAMRMWRLQEPQRRPGEPDFFFRKRMDEWTAKKPA